MKFILNCTIILFIFFVLSCSPQNKSGVQKETVVNLIPSPAKININESSSKLSGNTSIIFNAENSELALIARFFADEVKSQYNLNLLLNKNKTEENGIVLDINEKVGKKEAYVMNVLPNGIKIIGSDEAGLFYGVQTFLQLMDQGKKKTRIIYVPCVEIADAPTFSWRGMHLDVSRHFFSVDFVKKTLDFLAMHKMNVFHWHLTDDQGWRVEIKKYPKLTGIGAWRDQTLVGHSSQKPEQFDGIKYGGYYTQQQIKEVIEYAKKRYITIVPEIEMPGHAVAALAAYPEYSCTGGPFKVHPKWGITEDAYCAGKDATFTFLENILDEVINLFPGDYIHIGGDECLKNRWKACPACQQRMTQEGLKDETELQSYFTKRIEKFITSKGKKMIGWDEIQEGGLPERAAIMSWRGYKGGKEAAMAGHDVVMSPTKFCYFDYYQSTQKEPLAIGGFVPLDMVYTFDPVPEDLPFEFSKHILGGQANVWTEYMKKEKDVEYMVFPRLCAMAEVLWTPKVNRDYLNFISRLKVHLVRLEKKEIVYRPL